MNKDFDTIDLNKTGELTTEEEERKMAAEEKAGIHVQVLSILVDELRAAVKGGTAEKSEEAGEVDEYTEVSGESAEGVPGETAEIARDFDTQETHGNFDTQELGGNFDTQEITDAAQTSAEERPADTAAASYANEAAYADEENTKDRVFQGEVSVDTMLLTDISEEIKRDLQETQVLDVSKVKMVGTETMPLIDLDSDLFEIVGGRIGTDIEDKPVMVKHRTPEEDFGEDFDRAAEDADAEYADEDGYPDEDGYADEDAEYADDAEYTDDGEYAEDAEYADADDIEYIDEDGEYDDEAPGCEGDDAEYVNEEGYADEDAEYVNEEGYADEDAEYADEEGYTDEDTEYADEDAAYDEEDGYDEDLEFIDADEEYEDSADDEYEESADEEYEDSADDDSSEEAAEFLTEEELSGDATAKDGATVAPERPTHRGQEAAEHPRRNGKSDRSSKNGKGGKNGKTPKNDPAAAKGKKHKNGKKTSRPAAAQTAAKGGKHVKETKKQSCGGIIKIAIAAVLLFAVGMTMLIMWKWKGNPQNAHGYMYEVGQSLSSLGVAGESGVIAMAEAGRAAQDTQAEPTGEAPDAGADVTTPEGDVKVEVTFTSLEQDLKIKFIGIDDQRLVTDIAFEVRLQPASGDAVILTDADQDGIIYEKGIKSGDYTIELVPVDGYLFVGTPDSVNVREKIAYQRIDVAQEVKKESEINVAAEDTGVSVGAAGAPQVTMPAMPAIEATPTPSPSPSPSPALMNGDTVEWVESTKTPVGGGSGYKPVAKDSIVAPPSAAATIEVNNYDYAAGAVPCPGAARTLVRTEEQPGATDQPAAEATPTPTPEATATPTPEATATPTPEATATPTPEATATPTPEATATPTPEATATPTPESAKRVVREVLLDKSGISLSVGSSEQISATASMEDGSKITDGSSFSWNSSDSSIAKVDGSGKVTAVKVGTATISASYKDDNGDSKSASCMVSVVTDPKNDTTTLLRDKNGNQVYILKDGKYVAATYADYYSKSEFYISTDTEYTYTGWQDIDGNTYYFDRNGKKVTGEQQIQGVKYTFGADGVLKRNNATPTPTVTSTPTPTPTEAAAPVNTGGPVIGIDVSKWNGSIDWNAVKASGVQFVIIRCGYRGSTSGVLVEDSKFRSNIQGATAAGLKVGVYFFSQAINEVEAVEEASMTLAMMQGYGISYPVFIDTEFTTGRNGRADGLNKAARSAVCRAFCETIRSGGYTPGVYCSKAWLGPSVDLNVISPYKIWMAHYVQQTDYTGRYEMWQFTKNGSIAGIQGAVDMNYSYMN